MKKFLSMLCLILGIATLVLAAEPQPAPRPAADAPQAPAREVVHRNLDPEIQAVLDVQEAALAELNARFRAARSQDEAWEIQKLIRQAKIDAEIGIMEIQHRRLVAAGRTEEARSVAATLYALRNPDEARAAAARTGEHAAPESR